MKYGNTKKQNFLASIPTSSIEAEDDSLHLRCKFNFSYFEHQPESQQFSDWSHPDLVQMLEKLKEFGKQPLDYWRNQRVGKHGTVLAIYGNFPQKSGFSLPRHVPHQAQWGRFRLDWSARLCGFVLPPEYEGKVFQKSGRPFCSNTFYLVFLDRDHKFYSSESK